MVPSWGSRGSGGWSQGCWQGWGSPPRLLCSRLLSSLIPALCVGYSPFSRGLFPLFHGLFPLFPEPSGARSTHRVEGPGPPHSRVAPLPAPASSACTTPAAASSPPRAPSTALPPPPPDELDCDLRGVPCCQSPARPERPTQGTPLGEPQRVPFPHQPPNPSWPHRPRCRQPEGSGAGPSPSGPCPQLMIP